MKVIYIFLLIGILNIYVKSKPENGSIIVPMNIVKTVVPYNPGKNYFTIPIEVGKPKVTFNVQIDTSVATSWLPASYCKNCYKATTFYNHQNSTTSSPTGDKVELDDENGDVEGYKVQDTIEISGFKLRQFGFVEVDELDDDFNDHYDGKIGLGFRGELGHDYNFMEKLKVDGLISKRIFSIYELNSTYGMFLIGDKPVEYYKFCNVTYLEEVDDDYRESWICEITHFGLVNISDTQNYKLANTLEIEDGKVNFDSAYDYIAVPISYQGLFNKTLFDNYLQCNFFEIEDKADDEIVYICDKKEISTELSLTFVLQGNGYNILLKDLFKDLHTNDINPSGPKKMEFLIRFIDDDDAIWTFGHPFMREFMMIFNYEERHVGIHSTKENKIINLESDWQIYYQNELIEEQQKKNRFYMICGCAILAAFLVLFLICLICRGIKRRRMVGSDGRPIIEEENHYNPDRIY